MSRSLPTTTSDDEYTRLLGLALGAALTGKPVAVTLASEAHPDLPEYSANVTRGEALGMKREDMARARAHGFHRRARQDERRLAHYILSISRKTPPRVIRHRQNQGESTRRPRAQATRSSSRSGDSGDDPPGPAWLPGHGDVETVFADPDPRFDGEGLRWSL